MKTGDDFFVLTETGMHVPPNPDRPQQRGNTLFHHAMIVEADQVEHIAAWLDAIYTTARWANAHSDESARILAKHAKMDPEVVRTMDREPYGDIFGPDTYLELVYKYKYINRPMQTKELIVDI